MLRNCKRPMQPRPSLALTTDAAARHDRNRALTSQKSVENDMSARMSSSGLSLVAAAVLLAASVQAQNVQGPQGCEAPEAATKGDTQQSGNPASRRQCTYTEREGPAAPSYVNRASTIPM